MHKIPTMKGKTFSILYLKNKMFYKFLLCRGKYLIGQIFKLFIKSSVFCSRPYIEKKKHLKI